MDIRNPTNVTVLQFGLALFGIFAAMLMAIPLRRRLYRGGWRAPATIGELLGVVCYALGTALICGLAVWGGALMVCNALQTGGALNGRSGSHYVSVDAEPSLFWGRVILDYLMALFFLFAGITFFPPLVKNDRGDTTRLLVRNLIPLIGILWLGWSASSFLLLVVFQLALNLSLIIVLRATTSLLLEARLEGRPVSLRGIVAVSLVATFLCAFPTALIGWPIVMGSPNEIADRGWFIAVAAIVILAVSNLIARARANAAASMSDAALNERTRRQFFLSLIGILPIAVMAALIGDAHSIGTMLTVYLYVLFAIVLDLELAIPIGTAGST
jgi:hypothetical protein